MFICDMTRYFNTRPRYPCSNDPVRHTSTFCIHPSGIFQTLSDDTRLDEIKMSENGRGPSLSWGSTIVNIEGHSTSTGVGASINVLADLKL